MRIAAPRIMVFAISGWAIAGFAGGAYSQLAPGEPESFKPATTEKKTWELRTLHEPSSVAAARAIVQSRRGPWLSAKVLENSRTMAARSASGGSGDASRRALLPPEEWELAAATAYRNAPLKDPFAQHSLLSAVINHIVKSDDLLAPGGVVFVGGGDATGAPPQGLIDVLNQTAPGTTSNAVFIPTATALIREGEPARDRMSGATGGIVQVIEWSVVEDSTATVIASSRSRNGQSRTRIFRLARLGENAWKVTSEQDYQVGR